MKRLWIALGLLGLLLAATLYNAQYLDRLTGQLCVQLLQAEQLAAREDWGQSEALIRAAQGAWDAREFYLHVTLRHGDTDQIKTGFDETLRLLRSREGGEYAAASARLVRQLQLISEAEQLTLENLL